MRQQGKTQGNSCHPFPGATPSAAAPVRGLQTICPASHRVCSKIDYRLWPHWLTSPFGSMRLLPTIGSHSCAYIVRLIGWGVRDLCGDLAGLLESARACRGEKWSCVVCADGCQGIRTVIQAAFGPYVLFRPATRDMSIMNMLGETSGMIKLPGFVAMLSFNIWPSYANE